MLDILGLILMFLVIIVVHEGAHALTARALGYKLKKLYFGIPVSIKVRGKTLTTTLWKVERNGVEYGISWLILGGAVDFHEREDGKWWHDALVALMGPVSNFLMAYVAIAAIAGPQAAMNVMGIISTAVWQALAMLVTPQGIAAVAGPVGFVGGAMGIVQSGNMMVWVFFWALVNMGLFITNILPIPALDGGHIVLSIVVAIFGKRAAVWVKRVHYAFLYLLCILMLFVMLKDIWLLVASWF